METQKIGLTSLIKYPGSLNNKEILEAISLTLELAYFRNGHLKFNLHPEDMLGLGQLIKELKPGVAHYYKGRPAKNIVVHSKEKITGELDGKAFKTEEGNPEYKGYTMLEILKEFFSKDHFKSFYGSNEISENILNQAKLSEEDSTQIKKFLSGEETLKLFEQAN